MPGVGVVGPIYQPYWRAYTRFDEQDPGSGLGDEPAGDDAARTPAPDQDVIVSPFRHGRPPAFRLDASQAPGILTGRASAAQRAGNGQAPECPAAGPGKAAAPVLPRVSASRIRHNAPGSAIPPAEGRAGMP